MGIYSLRLRENLFLFYRVCVFFLLLPLCGDFHSWRLLHNLKYAVGIFCDSMAYLRVILTNICCKNTILFQGVIA